MIYNSAYFLDFCMMIYERVHTIKTKRLISKYSIKTLPRSRCRFRVTASIFALPESGKIGIIVSMKIADDCLVTLEYTLKDDDQKVLDSSEQMGPLDYVHGYRQLIPGLEKALAGREAGESFSLTVAPQQAYGEIDPRAVFEVSRAQFPPDTQLEVGMEFETSGHHVVITGIDGDIITLDANHPLAGKTLHFDIKIAGVRDATPEELEEVQASFAGGCGSSCGTGEGGCGGCSGCH